jgi:Putative lumazine-binding
MKQFLIVLTFLVSVTVGKTQSAEDSVKAVINNMFTGMRNADAVLLKSTFSDSIVFQSIAKNKEGMTVVKNENPAEFIDFISQQTKGDADEQISFETIKVDGPLAFAWTPYKFYFKGKFSHCGVNSFQLVRFNGVWKIQYIIDTRRRTGCE